MDGLKDFKDTWMDGFIDTWMDRQMEQKELKSIKISTNY
jgi:hypothetical protein